MPRLSAAVLLVALLNLLGFGVGFAVTAQLIADGSMRDQVHTLLGYVVGAVQAVTVAGWLWALLASARAGTPVNGAMQIMCAATAAAQFVIMLAVVTLIGIGYLDKPAGYFVGHVAVAALLVALMARSRGVRPRAGDDRSP